MRREHLYLQDIIEACSLIQTFLAGMDVSTFLASELHKVATLQKLTVIGEAAARLPQPFREAHSQVEWRDIVAFRNIAVLAGNMHDLVERFKRKSSRAQLVRRHSIPQGEGRLTALRACLLARGVGGVG